MTRAPERDTEERIRHQAARMRKVRRTPGASPLRGLSAFGIIGWSIAIPTVAGALLGLWLDRVAPRGFSWPVALILGGLVIGVIVAAEWVLKEARAMRTGNEEDRDT